MICLTLYITEGCHLCEMAKLEISQAISPGKYSLKVIDVITDALLMEKYAYSIPVLQSNITKDVLCWPFTANDIVSWLAV